MFIAKEVLDSKEIPGYIKNFLLHLVQYADGNGECYPSQATLGERMGKTPRMIRNYIKYCLELRLISVRRRWLHSNIYTILCCKQNLSTMRKSISDKQPTKEIKSTLPKTNGREIKVCLEDSKAILGETTFKRNYSGLYKMIRVAGYDIYQECLHWLRNTMLMAECDGKPIHSPSGMLTYQIRKFVTV